MPDKEKIRKIPPEFKNGTEKNKKWDLKKVKGLPKKVRDEWEEEVSEEEFEISEEEEFEEED
ncbi:MAG: hypothetical protein ACUVXA_17060 [Candidatus Jordarchaeum sp.]|uniref:hypothetical protein n=1 Tax=Candidatus Jordarchaeum sp. TaxID=2823881 RepID=UPI0040491D71